MTTAPFTFMDIDFDNPTIDLKPFVEDAMSRINVEIDRRVAHLAAIEMRKLGWICIPPESEEPSA